jgi:hypothetical protein
LAKRYLSICFLLFSKFNLRRIQGKITSAGWAPYAFSCIIQFPVGNGCLYFYSLVSCGAFILMMLFSTDSSFSHVTPGDIIVLQYFCRKFHELW